MTRPADLKASMMLDISGCMCAFGSVADPPAAECTAESTVPRPWSTCSDTGSDMGGLCVRSPTAMLAEIAAEGSASGIQKDRNDSAKAASWSSHYRFSPPGMFLT